MDTGVGYYGGIVWRCFMGTWGVRKRESEAGGVIGDCVCSMYADDEGPSGMVPSLHAARLVGNVRSRACRVTAVRATEVLRDFTYQL